MMVMGDDINDFNSNFTNNKGITYRENYKEDNNIQKLFGEPAMAIRFSKENDKIIKYYSNCGQSVDTLLLEKKQIQKIIKENICWYKSYSLIGGNAMSGGWDSCF